MKKFTLLFILLFTMTLSFSQVNITFEEGAAVINEASDDSTPTTNVTEYVNFRDQDGSELHTTSVEAITGGTSGNTSARAMKFELGANSFNYHFPFIQLSPLMDANNGNFITLKVLPASTGSTTFRLGLKAGGNTVKTYDVSYNPANTTDWINIAFDVTGFDVGTNRIDLGFEFGTRGSDNSEITWIDDIKQVTTLSTDTNYILGKRLDTYPNPTTGTIEISNARDYKSLKIYNLLGKNIKTYNAASSIDISGLPAGIYLLKTDTGLTKKVVKK